MANPYKSIIDTRLSGISLCTPEEMALFCSWNETTQRLEPTVKQFLAACSNDSVGTYTSISIEYLELLVEQGLDEDHLYHWQEAQEELYILVNEARAEFGYVSAN
jgi:hypothetical protein